MLIKKVEMSTEKTPILVTMNDLSGEFEMDEKAFFEGFIVPIMNAKPGTLAYQVRDDWVRVAVEINVDKL
jgi:hypothetical protein